MAATVPSLSAVRYMQRPSHVKLNVLAYVIDTIADLNEAKDRIASYLKMNAYVSTGAIGNEDISDNILRSYCRRIVIEFPKSKNENQGNILFKDSSSFLAFQCDLEITVIVLHDGPTIEDGEEMTTLDDENDAVPCQIWNLPNCDFMGLWDSLHFDHDIKRSLMSFASTGLFFADRKIDPCLIGWNRLILLHGPPGTGKTSLAKALSHELVTCLRDRFDVGHLVEINAHSLFSKWFSESGKLVARLFQRIRETLEVESPPLLFVLIDEVESLTASRAAAMKGCEPSDAIRVVNALLTQIDSLKRHPNVLVLATSNLADALDPAFVDRTDLQLHIPLPNLECRIQILESCTLELTRKKVIQQPLNMEHSNRCLLEIGKLTEGLSGRRLRKLPFQAFCLRFPPIQSIEEFQIPTFDQFCNAVLETVDYFKKQEE